jgi:DNA-binding MarR family transcriptional regulator
VREIERGLRDASVLTLERYDLLLTLRESPAGRERLTDLADVMLFSRGGITRLVAKLAGEGLVELSGSPEDARARLASLTPAGEAALRKTWDVYARLIERHFIARLASGDARALIEALGRVAGDHGLPTGLTVSAKPKR